MNREIEIANAIRLRNVASIVSLMFEGNPPVPRVGFKTETELWDYKSDCPKVGRKWKNAWADLACEILGFYNNKGGLLIFGIKDEDFSFVGASEHLDSKLLNDQIRGFLGDRIWVEYHRESIQANQRYLGIALIQQRGPTIERFKKNAPRINDNCKFEKDGTAIRQGDSTRILTRMEADEYSRKQAVPTLGKIYAVNEPFFKILAPDYNQFILRKEPCVAVQNSLQDPRSAVTSIVGIGGVGKTALATWAVLEAYESGNFDSIISTTAKDRELTQKGIMAIGPSLTSFESLLDNIFEVLEFPEYKARDIYQKETEAKTLLEKSNSLLYVDNLETVDDTRIIKFLDNLPVGCRAIVTSRRPSVRVSVRPVDLGPMEDDEIVKLIYSLAPQAGFSYVRDLSDAECLRIGVACDRIPLAIRWVLSLSRSAGESISAAERITGSGTHGEELLEFCFRRVFEKMPGPEKAFLQVLSLFNSPVSTETVLVGATLPPFKLLDSIETLVADGLIQRLFDEKKNDYAFTMLPMVRTFVYSGLKKSPQQEEKMRRKLSDWFEAKDVKDHGNRVVVREIRQGKSESESALIDLAISAKSRGDIGGAEDLFQQALRRNPRSWKAAKHYAEFLRHEKGNTAEALKYYEQAAANSPRRGYERAMIFREWGILSRDSGEPKATDLAIERLEVALEEEPNDKVTIHSLGHMYFRKGTFVKVIEILEPLKDHVSYTTRKKTLPMLLQAYERTGRMLEAAEIRPIVDNMKK